jgi:hypothetical protein
LAEEQSLQQQIVRFVRGLCGGGSRPDAGPSEHPPTSA